MNAPAIPLRDAPSPAHQQLYNVKEDNRALRDELAREKAIGAPPPRWGRDAVEQRIAHVEQGLRELERRSALRVSCSGEQIRTYGLEPHDLDAEAVVLSALLYSERLHEGRRPRTPHERRAALRAGKPSPAWAIVTRLLDPEDLYSHANGRIYEAILCTATERGDDARPRVLARSVDVGDVASWLRTNGYLAAVGGPGYLAQLLDATPAVMPARLYSEADRLLSMAVRRQAIRAIHAALPDLYTESSEAAITATREALVRVEATARSRRSVAGRPVEVDRW